MPSRAIHTRRSDERVIAAFAKPDAAHSPATYWFWHHLPTPDEIARQLQEIYAGGFRTVLIQCRLAYPQREYLSGPYLTAYRSAVEQAHTLGLIVGVYDEYNWQSGMAGGRTVLNRDHLREQHLFWTTTAATQPTSTLWISDIHCSVEELGEAAMSWQFEGGQIEWTNWRIVAALTHSRDGGHPDVIGDVTAFARITSANGRQCRIEVVLGHAKEGTYVTVFASARSATSKVPNYLLPETARTFIEVGYEPYWNLLSEYFGNTIQYFFFDQPHASFYRWRQQHGNLGSSLPFTPELAIHAQLSTGQGLGITLLALVMNVGPDTEVLRTNFYEAFTDLATRNFLGPLKAWTSQRGIYLTGHEVLGHVGGWHPAASFREWDLRVNFGLDYFGVDHYRGQTTVDAEGLDSQLSVKLGDSVARAHGRTGCTVEQYFLSREGPSPYAGHWGLSLEQLRAQALRLHFLGAKQFLMHAFYQSDGGAGDGPVLANPRFDFAPGVNFEPWWPFFSAFARESARLSTFLDAALPASEVAVLYPLHTIWAQGPRHSYGDHIAFWAAFLAHAGYGYHLIEERDLMRAPIQSGALWLDNRSYQVLVLPSVTMLQTTASLQTIEHFLASGGTVIASGDTPHAVQEIPTMAVNPWFQRLVRQYSRLIVWNTIPSQSEAARIIQPMVSQRPWIQCNDQGLWQWVGRDEAGWRLALFNEQADTVTATLQLPLAHGDWEIWDALSGDITRVPTVPARAWVIRLNPMKLLCLRLKTTLDQDLSRAVHSIGGSTIDDFLARCNRRPLVSGWLLKVGDDIIANPIDVDRGWEVQGLAHFCGTATYVCQIELPVGEARWWLYLPSVQSTVTVTWNDIPIGESGWSPYLFAIPSTVVHPGVNIVNLRVANTAANRYLGGTLYQSQAQESGILEPPLLLWCHEANAARRDSWGFSMSVHEFA